MPDKIDVDLNEEIRPARLQLEDKDKLRQIESELKGLFFTKETVQRIRDIFKDELEKGIRSKSSSLQMENTYIPELPDGTEEGKYLALDLGGTNFRVLLVEFSTGQILDVQVKHYHISEELRLGPGIDLFDYLAESMCDFLQTKGLRGQSIPLGFTFSFPMAQHSLKTGVLVNWTKSFNCPDVVGNDAVRLLNEALHRKGCCDVSVHAVLNDTTGTLMMGAFLDKNTCIGLILGTGSNACYLERADRVEQWETKRHGEKEVIIDIEWGAFGDNGVLDFIKTDYDVQVDENSLLVNSFTFEKYISGKYLGEIVRVILVRLVQEGLLFDGKLSKTLDTPESFSAAFISKIEEDRVNGKTENVENIISQLGINNFTADDIEIVEYVCRTVSNRSALLVTICLSALLDRMDKKEATIAVDGSLFQKHPLYRSLMERYIKLFTNKKFKLLGVSDGSGKGAAIVVAIAMKLEKRFGES